MQVKKLLIIFSVLFLLVGSFNVVNAQIQQSSYSPFFISSNSNIKPKSDSWNLIIPGGNIGIGVTNPLFKLDVDGIINASSGIISPKWYPSVDSTTALQINKADGTTNIVTIDTTNGRIGIGTSSPIYKLDVVGKSRIQSDLVIGSATPTTWTTYNGALDGGTNAIVYGASGDLHLISNAKGLGTWTRYRSGPSVNQYMYDGEWHLRTAVTGEASSAITWSDRLTVINNGNVGIGTASPTNTLQVTGAGKGLTIGARALSNWSVNYDVMQIGGKGTIWSGLSSGTYYSDNVYYDGGWKYLTTAPATYIGQNAGIINLQTAASGTINTAISWNAGLNIIANGNVGIGTATPSHKLDLIGDMELETTTSATTGVIYKNYGGGNIHSFLHDFHHPTGSTAVPAGGNTFIGARAGNFTMGSTATSAAHASYNVGIGASVLIANQTGYGNLGIGYAALYSNTLGAYNTAMGFASLYNNTTGGGNIALGSNSLYSNKARGANIAIGTNALYYADDTTSISNSGNIAIGSEALRGSTTAANNTGTFNVAIGYTALTANTAGASNVGIGYAALAANTTGYQNTAIGSNTLQLNTQGNNNLAMGYTALYNNTTGNDNVAIGNFAGRFISGGAVANTTCDYCTFIGGATYPLADNDQNEIVIGYGATGIGSNTVTLGNDSIVTTALKGNVGIGTTAPGAKLDVNGGMNTAGVLRNNYPGSLGYGETVAALNTYNSSGYVFKGSNITTDTLIISSEGKISALGIDFWRGVTAKIEASGGKDIEIIPNANKNILLKVSGTGNVGIGTTNPSGAKLHIYGGDENTLKLDASTGEPAIFFTQAGTNRWEMRAGSGAIGFYDYVNATWPWYMSNGNMGIGTTGPNTKLTVAGNIQMLNTAAWNATNTSVGALTWQAATPRNETYSFANIEAVTDSTTWYKGHLVFKTNNSDGTGNAPVERMRITPAGNVGIGTPAPTAVLHLKAGTATAGTAPLKFTTGTLLGTPEAGVMEYLTGKFYLTNATPTRKEIKVVDTYYAEMYEYENATSTVIGTQNVYHAVNDFVQGYLSGFTFVSGLDGAGTITDYSGTVAGTVLLTDATHGLLTGDIITVNSSTDYDGTYSITKVDNDTFYFTVAYVADRSANWAMGSYLLASAGSDGIYRVGMNLSAVPTNPNERFKFEINKNTTAQDNVAAETYFGNNDYNSLSSGGIILIAAGDRIWLSVKNETSSNDILMVHANINLIRL